MTPRDAARPIIMASKGKPGIGGGGGGVPPLLTVIEIEATASLPALSNALMLII